MKLTVIILAAGQGTRMRSALPKVLHPLGGKPMLSHVIQAARSLEPAEIVVVYGHNGEQVRAATPDEALRWVAQEQQLGTGHAVAQALPAVPDDHLVLVLYGDVPLIRADSLRRLVDGASRDALALLTVELDDPTGYGRIVRDQNGVVRRIVEQKDASAAELEIRECNTGLLAAPATRLKDWLGRLGNDNAQGEYYLTDIVGMAVADFVPVYPAVVTDAEEVAGVNDRAQLATLERALQRRQAGSLMRAGLMLLDPERFDLRGELTFGEDCSIDVNVVLSGRVVLGDRVRIAPNCVLRDVEIGDDSIIEPNSVLEETQVGSHCRVGPFARIRPGSELRAHARVGNFVEVKAALLQEGAKVNHLSYIGDAEIGRDANIGAGTITCNYDGANKHRTVIGERAFVGSGTNLVAPVTVGAGATIGAGSTISRDVPAEQLTLARATQKTVQGWQRPTKKKS
jgi:bifunctional UDP-N-acetylglucosamine pyrophosphorylase/glucosamine-1-phosphate N-acetyltransferase